MRKVFVDTAAWIALINVDDVFHEQAKRVKANLQQQKCQLITTDFVLLEVADALVSPKIRSQTIRFINHLNNLIGLQIIPLNKSLFDEGWKLYSQRLDKDWGLTDCISFVIMQQEVITLAFTSDRHFEQAGFTRLLNPSYSEQLSVEKTAMALLRGII
ncbi:type II toxin-antitoxin system VapC family toxin [Microcystis aeruginosa LEGE 11464]|uniref:type II toxin-antitoxin system VapC family toxin n=1 Tax=Microcystis aeruginosa TaxID=1126 RepID=UPI001880D995|nr:PIN domain-containing protein [Microcystis aeruginosa]MBE9089049.1 type II toxin-antitoxin system VapC family toxin [Microcystis aeruginosa LEGE 11464]